MTEIRVFYMQISYVGARAMSISVIYTVITGPIVKNLVPNRR